MTENFLVITGNDDFSIFNVGKEKINELEKDYPQIILIDMQYNEDTYDPLGECLSHICSQSLFAEPEVIYLKNFHYKKSKQLDIFLDSLLEHISTQGLGDKYFIISGMNIQQYKKISNIANIQLYKKPNLMDKNWRKEISVIIKLEIKKKSLKINYDALEYLIEFVGTETYLIKQEIEKLSLAVDDSQEKMITLAIVETYCIGNNAILMWELANALQDKDKKKALSINKILFDKEKYEQSLLFSLLKNISKRFNFLLEAKVLKGKHKISNTNYLSEEKKQELIHMQLLSENSYFAKKLFISSDKFSGKQLLDIIQGIQNLYKGVLYNNKSRLAMELFILKYF